MWQDFIYQMNSVDIYPGLKTNNPEKFKNREIYFLQESIESYQTNDLC